jgi:hypothetical protein
MKDSNVQVEIASCACGLVEIETTGSPIVCSACHCDDCREGSKQIESLPNAPSVLDPYGGTQYILYRKDRIKDLKGRELYKSLKVTEKSSRRVYASCCNSFLFLDLDNPMHWIPVSRGLFRDGAPQIQMRINAEFKKEGKTPPSDVPSFPSYPPRFIVRLLWAKIAMVLHI